MKHCILSAFQVSVKNSVGNLDGVQTQDFLLTNADLISRYISSTNVFKIGCNFYLKEIKVMFW